MNTPAEEGFIKLVEKRGIEMKADKINYPRYAELAPIMIKLTADDGGEARDYDKFIFTSSIETVLDKLYHLAATIKDSENG